MHIDRRIVKTRASIKNAFMQLIVEKEISKISVSDIAARAQINRSTFYLHYTDVPSVMLDIENEISEEITNCIDDFDIEDTYASILYVLNHLTDLIAKDEPLKKFITKSTNHDYIISRMKNILTEKTVGAILNAFPDTDIRLINYPVIFASAGVIDCYIKWCTAREESNDEISLENMIRQISNILDYVINLVTKN